LNPSFHHPLDFFISVLYIYFTHGGVLGFDGYVVAMECSPRFARSRKKSQKRSTGTNAYMDAFTSVSAPALSRLAA
jgi:hypothetical protein